MLNSRVQLNPESPIYPYIQPILDEIYEDRMKKFQLQQMQYRQEWEKAKAEKEAEAKAKARYDLFPVGTKVTTKAGITGVIVHEKSFTGNNYLEVIPAEDRDNYMVVKYDNIDSLYYSFQITPMDEISHYVEGLETEVKNPESKRQNLNPTIVSQGGYDKKTDVYATANDEENLALNQTEIPSQPEIAINDEKALEINTLKNSIDDVEGSDINQREISLNDIGEIEINQNITLINEGEGSEINQREISLNEIGEIETNQNVTLINEDEDIETNRREISLNEIGDSETNQNVTLINEGEGIEINQMETSNNKVTSIGINHSEISIDEREYTETTQMPTITNGVKSTPINYMETPSNNIEDSEISPTDITLNNIEDSEINPTVNHPEGEVINSTQNTIINVNDSENTEKAGVVVNQINNQVSQKDAVAINQIDTEETAVNNTLVSQVNAQNSESGIIDVETNEIKEIETHTNLDNKIELDNYEVTTTDANTEGKLTINTDDKVTNISQPVAENVTGDIQSNTNYDAIIDSLNLNLDYGKDLEIFLASIRNKNNTNSKPSELASNQSVNSEEKSSTNNVENPNNVKTNNPLNLNLDYGEDLENLLAGKMPQNNTNSKPSELASNQSVNSEEKLSANQLDNTNKNLQSNNDENSNKGKKNNPLGLNFDYGEDLENLLAGKIPQNNTNSKPSELVSNQSANSNEKSSTNQLDNTNKNLQSNNHEKSNKGKKNNPLGLNFDYGEDLENLLAGKIPLPQDKNVNSQKTESVKSDNTVGFNNQELTQHQLKTQFIYKDSTMVSEEINTEEDERLIKKQTLIQKIIKLVNKLHISYELNVKLLQRKYYKSKLNLLSYNEAEHYYQFLCSQCT